MIGAPSSFQSAQYGKVTMPKCLSNGKWNTTEILCNLVDAGNPENSERLKMKKLLLKICFILSGLRKSSQALVNEYESYCMTLETRWIDGVSSGFTSSTFNINFAKFLCIYCILGIIDSIKVSSESLKSCQTGIYWD